MKIDSDKKQSVSSRLANQVEKPEQVKPAGLQYVVRQGIYWGLIGGLASTLLTESLALPVFILSWIILEINLIPRCSLNKILIGNAIFLVIEAMLYNLLTAKSHINGLTISVLSNFSIILEKWR